MRTATIKYQRYAFIANPIWEIFIATAWHQELLCFPSQHKLQLELEVIETALLASLKVLATWLDYPRSWISFSLTPTFRSSRGGKSLQESRELRRFVLARRKAYSRCERSQQLKGYRTILKSSCILSRWKLSPFSRNFQEFPFILSY